MRGRSVRVVVGLGLDGWNGSLGQASALLEEKVGVVKAAVFVL